MTGWRLFANFRTAAFIAAGLVAFAAAPAPAQQPPRDAPDASKELPGPPEKLPAPSNDRRRGLDFLFGALKVAPDKAAARQVEGRIWAQWARTSSDSTLVLMSRAKTAADAKNYDVAIRLLDTVVKTQPDYVEGWNRRATLRYLKNEYLDSLSDIREVLSREPRHFGALTGLGFIMRELGDDRRALAAFRQALDVNPHLDRVPELVKSLTEKVDGRDI